MRGLPAYGVQRSTPSLGVLRQRDAGASSPLLTDLVSYWKLDEGSGTRIDSAGPNNLSDNNTVGSATGVVGNAASFVAGNSEYFSLSPGTLPTAYPLSLSLWLNPGVGAIKYIWNYSNSLQLNCLIDNNALIVSSNASAVEVDLTGLSGWYHLVVLYVNSTTTQVYLNGVLATSTSRSAYNMAFNITIGARVRSSIELPYNGLMDEIGIWGRVLTAAEITQLYNSGSGLTYPF
jgi:hypothetical protein